MKITIHVWKTRTDEEEHDLFLPFSAIDDARFISLRGETKDDAVDNVVGAVLCALGQKACPPRQIAFDVKEGRPKWRAKHRD